MRRAIFRAYDVRGVVGESLGEAEMRAIGRALPGLHPGCDRIAVGRDGRLSSPALAGALADGLGAAGAEVVDIGVAPTPVLYFAAERHCAGSGLMVTGSHNPPQYNGVKMMMGGSTLAGEAIQQLYAACVADDAPAAPRPGARSARDVSDEYIDAVAADIECRPGLRVGIDCGNGAAGPIARRLFRRLGCELHALYCDIDGRFPNHHPDPGNPDNMRELARLVADAGLDVGFAFDGDGDRLGLVDNLGRIVWPDRQMMVFAEHVLRAHPGATIIFDVKSSRHLERTIRRAGGAPHMCRTGHSFVKSALRETGGLLAGEMSGHIFFNDRWPGFDDALYAAARFLEILSRDGRPCADIFDALPAAVDTPELNIVFSEEDAQHRFMERLAATADFAGGPGAARVDHTDGLRVEFDAGWGLARASNTTPSLVLRFEADDEAALAQIKAVFRRELLKVEDGLRLPF